MPRVCRAQFRSAATAGPEGMITAFILCQLHVDGALPPEKWIDGRPALPLSRRR